VLLLGDTLFTVEAQPTLPSTPTGSTGPSTLYELDSFMNPGATLKAIATYKDSVGLSGANARLIVFGGLTDVAWDRAEHRFVRLGGSYILSGNYLIANTSGTAGNGTVPATVSIYQTAALPVHVGG
jgi:hypothetical protein